MDFPNNRYELILQPVSPTDQSPQWVLSYNNWDIASWTMSHRPSLLALLGAIRCWEEWNDYVNDCFDALGEGSQPEFKTYHPKL